MSQITSGIPASGPGSGTVTSITFNGGLTSTPDPVTTIGTATIDQTNLTIQDGTVYWDTGTQLLHTTATGTANQVLTSNGVGLPPSYQPVSASGAVTSVSGGNNITITGTATAPIVNVSGTTNHDVLLGNATGSINSLANGTTGQVLHAITGANDPVWSAVSLIADVTGVLPIANGGTNASSMATTDGTVYFDGTRLVTTATGTANFVLTSGGPGVAPTYQAVSASGAVTSVSGGNNITITGTATAPIVNVSGTTVHDVLLGNSTGSINSLANGTTGQVLHAITGANDPQWSAVSLTADISGILPIANGGTNASSMTNTDGVVYFDGTRLVTTTVGTATNVLTSNGAGVAPTFQAIPAAGVTSITGTANQITASASTGAVTLSTPSTFIAPGSIAATTTLTATLGNITATSGNLVMPATTSTVGQIVQAGNPILHTYGSTISNNIFVGTLAGNFTMTSGTAVGNTGIGHVALLGLTSGAANSAIGNGAGAAITTGSNNSLLGASVAASLTTGSNNTILGFNSAGALSTGSSNVMIGASTGGSSGAANTSNIYINSVGASESNTLRIGAGTGTTGNQLNATFISGITGITVTGTAVLVSASNQLGIAVSSAKYKENIKDMASSSDDLMKLRPVIFNYKNHDNRQAYGLIAEEVAEIYPDLVVYDKNGECQSVMYHEIPAMLLNEIQKLRKELNELKARL